MSPIKAHAVNKKPKCADRYAPPKNKSKNYSSVQRLEGKKNKYQYRNEVYNEFKYYLSPNTLIEQPRWSINTIP
jgi:hypothetical protein